MKGYSLYAMSIGFLIVLIAAGCSDGKYREAKKVMAAQLEAMKTYVSDIEKAENSKEMAESITAYSREIKKLIPEIKKMNEKYPELLSEEKRPEEMREIYLEFKGFSEKIQGAMFKVMKHMNDPEVRSAIKEQGEVMSGMGRKKQLNGDQEPPR
jgi:uncharacterized protein YjgD (DUF1641 family)